MSIVYFCISFTLRIGQLPFIQNLNIWLHLKATSRRMWNVSQCTNCIQSNPSSGKSSWHWWIKGSIFFSILDLPEYCEHTFFCLLQQFFCRQRSWKLNYFPREFFKSCNVEQARLLSDVWLWIQILQKKWLSIFFKNGCLQKWENKTKKKKIKSV